MLNMKSLSLATLLTVASAPSFGVANTFDIIPSVHPKFIGYYAPNKTQIEARADAICEEYGFENPEHAAFGFSEIDRTEIFKASWLALTDQLARLQQLTPNPEDVLQELRDYAVANHTPSGDAALIIEQARTALRDFALPIPAKVWAITSLECSSNIGIDHALNPPGEENLIWK